jgi:hypothetical protein
MGIISVNLKHVPKMPGHISVYTKTLASLRARETRQMEKQCAFGLTLIPQLKKSHVKYLKFHTEVIFSLWTFPFYNFQFSTTFRKSAWLPSSGKEMYLLWWTRQTEIFALTWPLLLH